MRIGSYDMESPLMNAGGVVKSIEDVKAMARTAVGAIVAGSYTLEPRVGNSPNGEVTYYHDKDSGITYNALGIPNPGLKEMAGDVSEMVKIAHDHGKPFILNIAPVTTTPESEVIAMLDELESAGVEGIDALELNASCPNVVTEDGGRHQILSHNPDHLGDVVSSAKYYGKEYLGINPLIVRISPLQQPETDAFPTVAALVHGGVNAIAAFNTFPNGKPLDANGKPRLQVPGSVGGQSGAGMASHAETQTKLLVEARDTFARHLEIIGSNGITSGETLKRRLDMGASAVSATTIFYQSADWGRAVDRIISEYIDLA